MAGPTVPQDFLKAENVGLRLLLEQAGIDAKIISTSPIKIACHILSGDVPRAVAALHDAFELEAPHV